jgi:type II secretory pathway component GspD/PulD (secretin)
VRLRVNGSARPWTFPFEAHNVDRWTFYPTPNPTSVVGTGTTGGTAQLAGFASGDSMPQALSSQYTFGILDATQLSALLEAIASDSSSDLIATPELTTLDNRKARINLGSRVPVPIFSNILNAQTNTVFPTITGFEYIDTGTILEVTPRVGADDYVTLDVAPEISEITGFVGPNQERPVLAQRKMTTSVVLRSGATLALGGLKQEKKTETIAKVPFLGDIPLLGYLFSHKTEDVAKTDLTIFITPEIVREERVAEAPLEKEARERGLVKMGDRWVKASVLDAANRVARQIESTTPAVRRAGVLEVVSLVEAERSEVLKRADWWLCNPRPGATGSTFVTADRADAFDVFTDPRGWSFRAGCARRST